MLQWLIAGTALATGTIALVAFWLLRGHQVVEGKGERFGDGFSPERYEPMHRLLAPEDLEFLKRRPGISLEAIQKLKQERIRIFKLYLNELSSDFQDLHSQVRLLVAEAPDEYSDLVDVVMQQQFRFRVALAGVHLRLALHQLGIGQVDVSRILKPVLTVQHAMNRVG